VRVDWYPRDPFTVLLVRPVDGEFPAYPVTIHPSTELHHFDLADLEAISGRPHLAVAGDVDRVSRTGSAACVRQSPWSGQFSAGRGEASPQLTVGGHDDHTASARCGRGGDPHDFVIARARGGDNVDAVGRGDTAGLTLYDQDHLVVVREWLERVAQTGGRAVPVTPPAVRLRADDVGRVYDQDRKCAVHLVIVPESMLHRADTTDQARECYRDG
jgi:hypothetical protein